MTDPDYDEGDEGGTEREGEGEGFVERVHHWLVHDDAEGRPAGTRSTADGDGGPDPRVDADVDDGRDRPTADADPDYGSMAYVDLDAGADDGGPVDDGGAGDAHVRATDRDATDDWNATAGDVDRGAAGSRAAGVDADGGSTRRPGRGRAARADLGTTGDPTVGPGGADGGVAGALAAELAAGDVDDRTLSALRSGLRQSGSTATDVRVDRLAVRVSEFDAYVDALEGLLDAAGDDENVGRTLQRLDERLGNLERESEADRMRLVEEVNTLREEVSLVHELVDSLQRWQRRLARVLVEGGTADVTDDPVAGSGSGLGPLRDGESAAGREASGPASDPDAESEESEPESDSGARRAGRGDG